MTTEDSYFSFLPLAHIFDRIIEELFIHQGASIGYWRGVRFFGPLFINLKSITSRD
jgi:long-subunit acyl-CoA synthetase (AMP-forming)